MNPMYKITLFNQFFFLKNQLKFYKDLNWLQINLLD